MYPFSQCWLLRLLAGDNLNRKFTVANADKSLTVKSVAALPFGRSVSTKTQ